MENKNEVNEYHVGIVLILSIAFVISTAIIGAYISKWKMLSEGYVEQIGYVQGRTLWIKAPK